MPIDSSGMQGQAVLGSGLAGAAKKKPPKPSAPVGQPGNWWDSLDWENMKPNQVTKYLLRLTAPALGGLYAGKEGESPNLYEIPELQINLPDIAQYMAGGQHFQNAYDQLAPSYWNTYNRDVENPLINRFAGSGTLGSAVGGVSGAAMDTMNNSRMKAGDAINAQVTQQIQQPLTTAYTAAANAATQEAIKPWEAQIEEYQYPWQTLPGIVSGTLPPKEAESSDGGGGGCFLTTACVMAGGLPDDCHQLQVLRDFRDKYVRNIPGGTELLKTYYRVAPEIVKAISISKDAKQEYERMFSEVANAVNLVVNAKNIEAVKSYKAMFDRLFSTYLNRGK